MTLTHSRTPYLPQPSALPGAPVGTTMRLWGAAILIASLLSACGGGAGDGPAAAGAGVSTTDYRQDEEELRQQYEASTIDLRGRVLDTAGQPLAAASITTDSVTVTTDSDGRFELKQLPRHNLLLKVARSGFYSELFPVVLRRPAATNSITMQDILLQARESGLVRFAFGGDTSFARRFMDPLEQSPLNEVPADYPDALVLASNPEPGAKSVLQYMKPLYQRADFAVVNFESPVTDNPVTPHATKEFKFFSLPESLKALRWAGIDYVSLGNNHLYDYLEPGTIDTLSNFDSIEISHSGAGLNRDQALAPHLETINNSTFSFLSMTSILGKQHSANYVASGIKGGAGNLTENEAVEEAIQAAVAGSFPIVQLHGGTEYSFEPTAYIESAMRRVTADGAALVIGHHPHVAQGFGREKDVFLIHSLGNMAFDQTRLETMLSFVAQVDMQADKVKQINAVPVYLEDYRPRMIAGRLGDLLLRRISEFSHDGLLVYPFAGQGWVAADDTAYNTVNSTTDIALTIDQSGSAIVDLREYMQSHQYIVSVATAGAALTVQSGRDILVHGDFEDWDIDEDDSEASRWYYNEPASWPCMSGAYRGLQGMCNTRASSNANPSNITFRNTARVMGDATNTPIKDLTLLGYFRATDAGAYTVKATYITSIDSLIFGDEIVYSHPGGSHDWQRVEATLNMPDDSQQLGPENLPPRGVRLELNHEPPADGNGLLSFDEWALVSWEDIVPQEGFDRPNDREFLRVTGAPGEYQLTLQYRHLVPAATSR